MRTQQQILKDMLMTVDQLRCMVDVPEDVQNLIKRLENDMHNRAS